MTKRFNAVMFSESGLSKSDWDSFVENANGGTIFHRLDFLGYHGERFSLHERHLVFFKGETLFGVMPMAVFEENGKKIAKSPYGASYGGPVFRKRLTYSESSEVLDILVAILRTMGVKTLEMTLPIAPAYDDQCETFQFCLLEHGFNLSQRDISSVVRMAETKEITLSNFGSRGRNMARKASKLGVQVIRNANLELFWRTLCRTFEKHGHHPTHSKKDLVDLNKNFPDRIYFDVAIYEEKPIAGICYFVINRRVNSSFYFAIDPEFQAMQGLSLLIRDAILCAGDDGFDFFDFGTSTVEMRGRGNIFRFKESFGALGSFRNTFVWENN